MKIDLRNTIAINAQKNILVLLQSYENPNEELGEDVILIDNENTDAGRATAY
jgi:hypothetical protein